MVQSIQIVQLLQKIKDETILHHTPRVLPGFKITIDLLDHLGSLLLCCIDFLVDWVR